METRNNVTNKRCALLCKIEIKSNEEVSSKFIRRCIVRLLKKEPSARFILIHVKFNKGPRTATGLPFITLPNGKIPGTICVHCHSKIYITACSIVYYVGGALKNFDYHALGTDRMSDQCRLILLSDTIQLSSRILKFRIQHF